MTRYPAISREYSFHRNKHLTCVQKFLGSNTGYYYSLQALSVAFSKKVTPS